MIHFVKKHSKLMLSLATAAGLAGVLVACSSGTNPAGTITASGIAQGKIHHVFVITLENENYTTTFGANTAAPYLATTLASQGALLTQYFGTGHVSLDNYISMMSGQPGTVNTIADCQTYQDMAYVGTNVDGSVTGTGCVYPSNVKTLADQVTAAGLTWKGYMGDMGNDPTRESATCGHPTLNTADHTQAAEAPSNSVPLGDQYATRHDPFMYFHSITDSPGCATHVVNLDATLQTDLASLSTTPNFVYITPSLCDDGHDAPCVDGRPGGLTSVNTFLQKWIPIIQASAAYQQDGVIIINFDESGAASLSQNGLVTNVVETGTPCCNQQPGPNLPAYPQQQVFNLGGGASYNLTYENFGGDRVGAVILSRFIKPGTVSATPYNHYSLLRTIEDIFGISTHLGYAGQAGLVSMGTDVFTNAQ